MAEAATALPDAARLNATFAPAARERITAYLQSFRSFAPSLGLLYGDPDGALAGQASWSLVAYGSSTVDEMITLYASFGGVVRYEIDGVQVLIPQMGRISELDNCTLDFVGDRLVAAPRAGT